MAFRCHRFASGKVRRTGFTLAELMVAVGVFALGAAIVYPLFVGDFGLYVRNFSINKSNNSLRYALQMLKNDIDMAIEPPLLMGYRTSGTTGILKPLTNTTVSAQAILLWVNLGPAYDLVAASGATINPGGGVTLTRASAQPAVRVGDRLVIMSPAPYGQDMPENVLMDGVTMQKPGRRITGITSSTATSLTVQLDLTTTALPANIPAGKSAYIVREVAYAANPITDSSGNVVERQLVYYPSTNDMTNAKVLVRDLDTLPQEIDTATGATVQPFNFYGGRANLSVLNVILPIRAVDYARSLNDRRLGGAATNTSATEFDVYLRSASQMSIKARID